jgi:hypothetical protein
VHPANKVDPTDRSMTGTAALRKSYSDDFNVELTFSLILNSFTSFMTTFDIECDTFETYHCLLQGFELLVEQSKQRRMDMNIEYKRNFDKLSKVWNQTVNFSSKKAIEKKNPINSLFAPANNMDLLRAVRVGSGVFSWKLFNSNKNSASPQIGTPNFLSLQASLGSSATLPPPPHRFLGWHSAGTQIWARLKMAGFKVKCVFSWDLKRVIFKIKCPNSILESTAEKMRLKIKSKNGYLKQFKVSKRDTFMCLGSNGSIFRSSERQQIIDYILISKMDEGGSELGENSELGKEIVQRFPLHMYSRLLDIRHRWVLFWKMEQYGEIVEPWSPFRVPYRQTYDKVCLSVSYFFENLFLQPLDGIAEYFGESIAFYFAYKAYYTWWLILPMILGFIVFCVQVGERKIDHWLCIPFSVFINIWACFMFAYWPHKSSVLAYRYGVLDYEVYFLFIYNFLFINFMFFINLLLK